MQLTGLVKALMETAVQQNAEDIYVLPCGEEYEIRIRNAQGVTLYQRLASSTAEKLFVHFKYLADMDVSEVRKPQLGSCDYPLTEAVRLRISTVANFQLRESMVIRLLRHNEQRLCYATDLAPLQATANRRGLHLFAGPVSSGKTTLMYHLASCHQFQQVITIEDPVELIHDAFLQLQVNQAIGVDYESLIKLSLRHHPDLLIIGEIRDEQTAQMAIRAALTGHVVYATIHAKSTKGILARLKELQVSEHELLESLQSVTYQRLLPFLDGSVQVVTASSIGKEVYTTDDSHWNKQITDLQQTGRIASSVAVRETL
ncbi:hypothetical protein RU97_GL001406 [Enterococcus canis]|uniref:Bacterial type II secretion system protein E domain-containing protein n=1 Tax=Enterococcus canis TaxID=214095 RepID=A0A1L8RGA4_9ENTE|nr:competence type IV pilus ATPase ComGA [Enterococcus canis]OJG18788.1 hypothetical protein RU97_GL001406 [Enterococcus canis]